MLSSFYATIRPSMAAFTRRIPLMSSSILAVRSNATASSSSSSSTAASAAMAYAPSLQLLHWVMGAGVMTCIGTVIAQQQLPKEKKELKGQLMMVHKSSAVIVMALLAPRLAVRLLTKIPQHVNGPAWQRLAGEATHLMLYAGMVVMPVSGFMMGYFGGKGIPFFGLTTIPGAQGDAKNGAVAKQAFFIHQNFGYWWKFLVPAHIGATAYYYFVAGQNLLPRMGIGMLRSVK